MSGHWRWLCVRTTRGCEQSTGGRGWTLPTGPTCMAGPAVRPLLSVGCPGGGTPSTPVDKVGPDPLRHCHLVASTPAWHPPSQPLHAGLGPPLNRPPPRPVPGGPDEADAGRATPAAAGGDQEEPGDRTAQEGAAAAGGEGTARFPRPPAPCMPGRPSWPRGPKR